MSLIFMDGFDAYGANGNDSSPFMQTSQWDSARRCFGTSDTRTGVGLAVLLAQDQPGQGQGAASVATDLKDGFVVGFAVKTENPGFQELARFLHDDLLGHQATQLSIFQNGVAGISVLSPTGSLVAASLPNTFFPSVWQYLEVKITFGASGGFEVRVDGATLIAYTGVVGAGSYTANILAYTAQQSSGLFLDDLYICDLSAGAPYNDFLGDCAVHTVFPTADNGPNTMTQVGGGSGHFTSVREVQSDEDTSYVESDVAGQEECYSVGTLPADIIDVLAVAVVGRAKKSAPGIAKYELVAKSGGSNTVSAPINTNVNYFSHRMIMTTVPGGGGWTRTLAQGLKIGVFIP
jgi:hypothetical protein